MQDSYIFDIYKTHDSITIIFSSTMENIDRTCDETIRFLTDMFNQNSFSDGYDIEEVECSESFQSHLFAIQLVMREGLTNAVRHGNRLNSSKTVRCSVQIIDNKVVKIEIEDQGKGFNWKKELESKCMDDTLEHGRGLMIIEQYFSKYIYNERGNKLILEKNISYK
ncbi:MAG: ATP-binding protein [Desulfamplus sp.]|nr:ATP-binding protein [Desulfamplus sp.]MBF0413021.1 ATP-binding protein [Desulfamplus sp.]